MTIHTFSDEQLAGQRLMVGFEGREFNEDLRELIGRLYVGGLILFSQNIAEPDQLQRLCRDCQDFATRCGQPPLVIAVDQDNVSMTTRLMNGKTRFLPFNRGRDGGAGNPDVPGENRVAYLYKDLPEAKAVFSREVLLDLVRHEAGAAVLERALELWPTARQAPRALDRLARTYEQLGQPEAARRALGRLKASIRKRK